MKVLCKGGVPFLSKQIYRKVLDLKAELHNIKLCCGIPPPPGGTDVFYPRLQAFAKESLVHISKKQFSLFKSVTGDILVLSVRITMERVSKGVLPKGAMSSDSLKAHHKN